MDYKFVASRHLKCLLNDVENKQKQDIHDYTRGHLNISRLRQPPEILAQLRGWQTSMDSSIEAMVKSKSKIFVPNRQNKMKDVLYQFSVGTTGCIPNIKRKENAPKKLLFLRDDLPMSTTPEPLTNYIQDGVLIEELDNKEICFSSRSPKCKDAGVVDDNHDRPLQRTFPPTSTYPSTDHHSVKHKFVPVQTSGITKHDQYKTFKMFESSIIRKKDSSVKNVLTGNQAVAHHEKRLKQVLALLNMNGTGPNFHKLQMFSNSFEDVIEESPTFKFVLSDIKTVYDEYVSKLLDTQTAKHQLLHDQVEQMAVSSKSQPQELQRVKNKVEDLEIEGKWLLEENQRLRDAVREEYDLLSLTPEHDPVPTKTSVYHDEPPTELAEELEHYKALILEKLDALNSLRSDLRDQHVPLTVCTHLEQCIKETEIEVQKLLKQNEYFERSIADMEHDLKEAIHDADTSEKDARRIWRKVNSLRAQPGDDDEDEGKWNWYIS